MKERLVEMLNELQAERDRLETAIAALEVAIGGSSSAGKAEVQRRPGKRRAKRAKAGLLQKTMEQVLSAAKKPLSAGDLRDAVMAAGYPTKNPKSLYTALYTAAGKDSRFVRDAKGFSLKKRPEKAKAKKGALARKKKAAKKSRRKAAKAKK